MTEVNNDESVTRLSNDIINFVKRIILTIKIFIHGLLTDLTDMIVDVLLDIPDLRPIPPKFDYSYFLISCFWSVVFMSSKTIGHRLSRIFIVHVFLNLLNTNIFVIITYALLPLFVILIDSRISYDKFSLYQRRILFIILGFWLGLFSEHIWIHWIHISTSEPSYYFPTVVGLLFQIMGPIFGHNRFLLWFSTVGFSSILNVTIAMRMQILGLKYITGTIISTFQSTLNFQMLIGDLRRRRIDEVAMTSGQLKSLIISVYVHAFLTFLNATYDPLRLNTTDI